MHISGVIDDIVENDKVTFELEKGQRGMNAVKVKKNNFYVLSTMHEFIYTTFGNYPHP